MALIDKEPKYDLRTGELIQPKDDQDETIENTDPDYVSSFDDERVANNVMRHEYKVLNDEEKLNMQIVKDLGLGLHQMIDTLGQSRETSLAKTKAEEAVMWAVKHITG